MSLNELRLAEAEAKSEYTAARERLESIVAFDKRQTNDRIDRWYASGLNHVNQLFRLYQQAKQAREIAEIESAMEGTLVHRREDGSSLRHGDYVWRKEQESVHHTPVTIRGIVEIRTYLSRFPGNERRRPKPDVGSLFVRILKTDGRPSKQWRHIAKHHQFGEWQKADRS